MPTGTLITRSVPLAPVWFLLLPWPPLSAREVHLVGERDQRVGLGVGLQVDVAPAPAVAAARPATRHVRLAPECDRAVAAVARFHVRFALHL